SVLPGYDAELLDHEWQRESLPDQRHEDDGEDEEQDQVALREARGQRERGRERDHAAEAGPTDDEDRLPRRVRIVACDGGYETRQVRRGIDPHDPRNYDRPAHRGRHG